MVTRKLCKESKVFRIAKLSIVKVLNNINSTFSLKSKNSLNKHRRRRRENLTSVFSIVYKREWWKGILSSTGNRFTWSLLV